MQIHTLGGLRIRKGNETITGFETRKVEALLLYLACNRRRHPREVLAELLWDERSQSRAQSNLRVALANLRKHLGEYLLIDRETAALNPEVAVWLDASEFEKGVSVLRASRGLKNVQQAEQVEQAIELYQGEFLAGFYVREARGFEDWMVRERERLHHLAVDALHDLVEYELDTGEDKQGLKHVTRLLELDPLMEDAHRQKMRLLAHSGRRNEALAQYETLKRVLWDDLGVHPSESTKGLVENIRAGSLVRAKPVDRAVRNYRLHEQIGQGSFGAVYRAYQQAIEREVAVKVILPQYANDPEFIRRFEVEAQTIARLEHPHIVPLYDYWREPDGAYLVMRWLRGGSLGDQLARGPLAAEQVLRVVEQATAGLNVAHQQGVIHRDLKPQNILLDEAGNAYLSDFGIAKDLQGDGTKTEGGILIGSPVYMSPEQIRSQPLTPQSDIYSLGILCFELLAGELPFQADSLSGLIDRQLYEPLPSLRTNRPELPAAVDEVLQRATAKEPDERFPDVLAFAAAFQAALSGMPLPATPVHKAIPVGELTNPYKGLRAFQEADAEDFFGREALVERLLARLSPSGDAYSTNGHGPESGRFLAVVGPSGSGKSSVVRAGLLPALRRGALPGSDKWFMVELLPGPHPLEELEAALLRVAVNPPESLLGQFKEDRRGLSRAVKRILPADERIELLLIMDQFEEVFTLVEDPAEARYFLDSLHAAVSDPRSRLRVVLTLRADFYDRPLMHSDFSQLVRHHTEAIVPLTAEELSRAIGGPAQRAGISLEEGLAPAIVAEVNEQPGALPLLQYALTELFERRSDGQLTRDAYQAIGGVSGALGKRAEEIYQELDPEGQETARQLFLRLVTLGEGVEDTRRRALQAELEALTGHNQAFEGNPIQEIRERGMGPVEVVLDAYGRARLLSFDRDPLTRGPTVEVAHEALLREWRRLRDWLDESREGLRLQRRLGVQAGEWLQAGRDPGFLLRGSRLDQFEAWAAGTDLALTADERAYLQESLAERRARRAAEAERKAREARLERRSRNFLRVLVLVLLLATVGSLVLVSIRSREAQVNQSLALAAQSRLALQADNLDLALALAWEANQITDPPGQAQMALSEAAYAPGTIRVFTGHQAAVLSVAVSPDGVYGLSGDEAGVIFLWDLETGEALRQLKGHAGAVTDLAFTPDGRHAVSASQDSSLIYWDLEAAEILRRLEGHQDRVNAVAISPDGRLAASVSGRKYDDEAVNEDNSLRLWDLQSGEEVRRFDFFADGVTGVDFTPDGRRLALATISEGFSLLDVNTKKVLLRSGVYLPNMLAVEISPDGRLALVSSFYHTIFVWDLHKGEVIGELRRYNGPVTGVAISPDGQRALGGSQWLIEWELGNNDEEIQRFSWGTNAIAYLPDGKTALIASWDHSVRLLGLGSGAEKGRLTEGMSGIMGLAYTPEGDIALIATLISLFSWDLETNKNIWSEPTFFDEVAFSLDGKRFLVSQGNLATLRDTETGKTLLRLESDGSFEVQVYLGAVALHPSGKYAMTGSQLGPKLIYWDLESGKPVWLFETEPVLGVAISPDGRTALSAEVDGAVNWWDLETGQLLKRLEGHTNLAWGVSFIDNRTALSTSDDRTMVLWDLESGTPLRTYLGHTDGVKRVALSPDKRLAISASRDGTAILWDVQTGEPLRRYSGHKDQLRTVAFHPNGVEAVTGGQDSQVIRWRIDADLKSFLEWVEHNRHVRALTCAEREVYNADPLCTAEDVADERAFAEESEVATPMPITGEALLPPLPLPTPATPEPGIPPATPKEAGFAVRGENFGSIPVGGGQVWDYTGTAGETLSILAAAPRPVEPVWSIDYRRELGLLDTTLAVYNPDGSPLAQADDLENGVVTDAYLPALTLPQSGIYRIEVRSYRDESGGDYRLVLGDPRPLVFDPRLPVTAGLAIHPDGQTVLIGVGNNIYSDSTPSADNRIRVWDIERGEVVHYLEGHANTSLAISIRPDGRMALSAGLDGVAILWNLENWTEVKRFDNAGQPISGIQFHPDGETFLTSSFDATLARWDLESGEVLQRFEGHTGTVFDLAISPDGMTLYSASEDKTVRTWDLRTGESLATYRPLDEYERMKPIALSPDGSRLLVGGGNLGVDYGPEQARIVLLDARTGEKLQELIGHATVLHSIAFSPDGRYALTGSEDQTVRLWEVDTGEQLTVFYGHAAWVWEVAFGPEGLTGYSTGLDGALRVWDLREYIGEGESEAP